MRTTEFCRVYWCALFCCLSIALASMASAGEKGIADFPRLSAENDWPWWRGPQRNGIARSAPVPTTFSETQNLTWKVPVPGRGHASPTVVGTRIFLATADDKQQVHSILGFDRRTGKQLWKTDVNQGGFPEKNHEKNTEATPTIASDGERVFATFYHHDKIELLALDFDGQLIWKKDVGPFYPKMYEYGYAPSPILYQDSVIVAAEYDGDASFLTAFDRKTGERRWRAARPRMVSYSSPVIGNVAGKDQLLISGALKVSSYDPVDGKALWSIEGTTAATCGTMVWEGDTVFASGGYPKSETIAVKADGSGKVVWKNNQKCYEQSMLAHKGYLYALTDNGILYCWRASDGKEMWKERLKGPISASPVLAGDHIYWANELGTMYVFRANPDKFELVAENQIGTDSFPSPAICGGQIFLRVATGTGTERQEWLYCFARQD